MDGMVRLVRLLTDLRAGRQDEAEDVRESRAGLWRTALRWAGPRRDLLPDEPTLPGQVRPTRGRPMVGLERLERMHGQLRWRIPITNEALR